MIRRPLFLAATAGITLLGLLPSARADLIADGQTHVPVMLTLEGQDAFKDTTFVIAGCSSENGRHYVAFAKPNEPLRCSVKMPPAVHAIPTAEKKPIEDLVAKDIGWGSEGVEVRKLLEKAPECGKIEESSLVEKSAGIKEIAAKYALEKTASGCSLKKVSSTQVLLNAAATQPATPAASASATPAASASAAPATTSTAPAPKSGCAMAPSLAGTLAGYLAIAVGILALARRRARS